jgi:hypothetical protein
MQTLSKVIADSDEMDRELELQRENAMLCSPATYRNMFI